MRAASEGTASAGSTRLCVFVRKTQKQKDKMSVITLLLLRVPPLTTKFDFCCCSDLMYVCLPLFGVKAWDHKLDLYALTKEKKVKIQIQAIPDLIASRS